MKERQYSFLGTSMTKMWFFRFQLECKDLFNGVYLFFTEGEMHVCNFYGRKDAFNLSPGPGRATGLRFHAEGQSKAAERNILFPVPGKCFSEAHSVWRGFLVSLQPLGTSHQMSLRQWAQRRGRNLGSWRRGAAFSRPFASRWPRPHRRQPCR